MASPVYTVLLASESAFTGGTLVPSPPSGFRYVVTDIDAWSTHGYDGVPLDGFTITDSNNAIIWGLSLFAFRGKAYHWRGRQVVDVGDELDVATGDTGWDFRVSGFRLSLP